MPKFREITGQFVGYIPDSIDSDIVPDRAPMDGRVTFTPVFTGGVIAFPELVPPEFAHPRTIHAKIVNGFVQVEVNEGEGDEEQIVLQPLSLMVTVDDEASQVWSWRAEFSEILIGASDEYVTIPSWSFRVPDGTGPVDLTELVPLKSGGTVDVTKGPRGAGLQNITAVDGQLVFAYSDGEETTVPMPEAVQGPQGEPGPAGADGAQGPEGPQGPAGEIPDLLVGNITDATPTGKNLMLAATEGAARNALGLAAGATASNGALSELNTGTSNTARVWTPANIANYVTAKAQETTDSAKTVVNVKDHGAVGDGATDDSPAIQAAMNELGNRGGGVLFFPPGDYLTSDYVKLVSNVEITGKGATLMKKAGSVSVVVFAGIPDGSKKYGAGPSNIYCHDLVFRGVFGSGGRGVCGFALNQSENVFVENCEFIECSTPGHRFDLGGCKNVTISSCTFKGLDITTITESNYYNEDIQLDNSTRFGSSHSTTDIPDSAYSGLPCVDVLVTNCKWLPLTTGGITYPASFAIGSHAQVEGMYQTNITIENNYFSAAPYSTHAYAGVIHAASWKNVTIKNNTFDGGGSNFRCINLMHGTRAFPVDGVHMPQGSAQTVPVAPAQVCQQVRIEGNTFTNFAESIGKGNLIYAYGSDTYHTDLIITNNLFKDLTSDYMENIGPNTLELYGVSELTISGNSFKNVRRALHSSNCRNITFSGNDILNSAFGNIALLSVTGQCSVTRNNITGYVGTVCVTVAGADNTLYRKIVIADNTISTWAGKIVAVRVQRATRPIIRNNSIERLSPSGDHRDIFGGQLLAAVELNTSVANAVLLNNVFINALSGVTVDSGSTVNVEQGTVTI